MTTKNLSRELCKICEIEPISRCDYCPRNCLGPDVCKRGESIRYPDFTQPENFVKLIELRFTAERGDFFTVVEALQHGRCFIFADRKSFLEQLLDYIFACENFGEYIKQAIKSEVWKYE